MTAHIVSHLFPHAGDPVKGVFVLDKAKALARRCPVRVLAPIPYVPFLKPAPRSPPDVVLDGIPVSHPRYLTLPSPLFAWRWAPYAAVAAAHFRRHPISPADTIFMEWVYPDAFATYKILPAPRPLTLITLHGNDAIGWSGAPARRTYYQQAMGQADGIVAVSRELRDRVIQQDRIDPARVIVIPNGLDETVFTPRPRLEARARLKVPPCGRILLAVARLSAEKRLGQLVDAFAQLRLPDATLYIIGDGPLKAVLAQQIRRNSLEGIVRCVGAVPHADIPLWLSAADLLCLPSATEGSPVVIHEALACGLPVVATQVGGIPDLIRAGQDGLLCPPDDPAALAEALRTALALTWNCDAIVAQGRRWTWTRVADQLLAFARDMDGYKKKRGGQG